MKLIVKFHLICVCAIFGTLLLESIECLLFSQFTLMQVVFAVSWPIPYKNPLRKLFFNIGFQFNYNEPFRQSSFYNATYFQNPFTNRDFKGADVSLDDTNQNSTEHLVETTTGANKQARSINSNFRHPFQSESDRSELIGNDLTAAQLYESIEDSFFEIGYDRSCLLKSICELARHPLHQDHEEHLLADIFHFLLTPTEHQGFADHERYEREKYVAAEQIGESGADCNSIYPECKNSVLNQISYLSTDSGPVM